MQNTRLLLAFWLATTALGGAAECRQSLDGTWQFSTNHAAAVWDALPVPGNWDTTERYSTYQGKGWYRREFTVPADWKDKHIRLRFEAVYHDATVTLNGVELGTHVGGYTPFEFDVTAKVNRGGPNTLTVCADNSFRRGAWWHWGGISRSVNLLANGDVRIVWQHIRTEPDLKAGTAQLFVTCQLANDGATGRSVTLTSRVEDLTLTKTVALPAGAATQLELSATLAHVRLWDFDHPHLYRLTTSVAGEEKTDRFGIRKVVVTPEGLWLNGEQVRLCGFNRVSDSRETGNTEPDELVKKDVDMMKRCGANLARLMHYPQAPNLLDYLDEKGMLIWEEIPVWGDTTDPNMKPDNPVTRQWLHEMIERDYNHPCIIGWSVGNELLKHYDYVKSMLAVTRQLDPHRLHGYVSYSGARKDYRPDNDPISLSDLCLHNTYGATPGQMAETLRQKWPRLPVFFSEFGSKQFGATPGALIPGLEERWASLQGHPYIIGVALWTFNDYRSDYKGTPPSGNREWGVVDVQRRPKAAYAQIRKLYAPVHTLRLADGVVRIVPRQATEIPAYTLRGYKLTWDGGELTLPDLKPGDPEWSGPCKARSVRLVTPTGYAVAEAGDDAGKVQATPGQP